ncbi:MAG: hypothetical protein ACI8XX_002050 [Polaribacter sp.]|jgi:uncharacterized protein (DUF1330 family)
MSEELHMTGYWMVRSPVIKDDDALTQYAKLWGPIAQRYGAEFIAGKGLLQTREGNNYARQAIIRFPSYDDAINCYDDPEYQALLPLVGKAFDRDLTILAG